MTTGALPHFELLRRLGRGGMGEVHLAMMETASGRQRVALKRLRADLLDDADLARQLTREARICSLLRHPKIVAQLAYGADAQGPFLAMEYVEGCTASALLTFATDQDRQLDSGIAAVILKDVAEALHHAHSLRSAEGASLRVIHRDVSTDNVLLSTMGDAKLSDFGVARMLGSTKHTQTGTLKGKYLYMAPELFDGREANVATDVYAFAVLAYRLFTGISPISGKTDADQLRRVLHVIPPRIQSLRPDLPEAVADVIDRGLAKAAADRPASMRVVSDALDAMLEHLPRSREALAAAVIEASRRSPVEDSEPEREQTATRSAHQVRSPGRSFAGRALLAASTFGLAAALAGALFLPQRTSPEPETSSVMMEPEQAEPPVEDSVNDRVPAAATKKRGGDARHAKTATRAKHGTLVVKVKPWADVYVDGELVGTTPLLPLSLSEGLHSVVIVNSQLNQRKSYQVRIPAGGQHVVKAILTSP